MTTRGGRLCETFSTENVIMPEINLVALFFLSAILWLFLAGPFDISGLG